MTRPRARRRGPRPRWAQPALTCLLALLLAARAAAPATAADDPRQRRDATHAKREQAQAQLNLALASDQRVEAEVNRLDGAVAAQHVRLGAARADEARAQSQVAAATQALAAVEAREAAAQTQVANQAVDAYIHGGSQRNVDALLRARSLDDAVRRRLFLTVAQADTRQLVDALRAAREDRIVARKALDAAHQQAAARAAAAAQVQHDLDTADRAARAAGAELQTRIAVLREETRQYQAQESSLEALIRSQEAAAAARSGGRFVPGRISNVGLIWPMHGEVTSEYGPRWGGFHPGIDIANDYGTPIHAAKDGTVIYAGDYGGYGNFVVIDHGGGVATAYAHQDHYAVSQGQTVRQGQVIGYEGSTGYSTGPHLHFEVRIDGTAQNPRLYESGDP